MGYLDKMLQTYRFKKVTSHWYANGDKGLPIISLAGFGLLVKMLFIIEQLGIFCILIHFSIIKTQ